MDLLVRDSGERQELLGRLPELPSLQISMRAVCDLELLAVGAFSPLDRFMSRRDYDRVVEDMRLVDGSLFPLPITLAVRQDELRREWMRSAIILRSPGNDPLAIMRVEDVYAWDFERESHLVYGTADPRHPMVAEMLGWGRFYISGPLRVLNLPKRHAFRELYHKPSEVWAILNQLEGPHVVAFQTRNPLHRSHEFISKKATKLVGGTLLIQPAVGLTKAGDVDAYTRIRCYQAIVERYYDPQRTLLSLIPLAMRMAGPREALWHGIIRRNYGATHFVVGRDHAGPGNDSKGRPFYPPFAAQELFAEYEAELGVRMVQFDEVVYLPEEDRFEEFTKVPPGREVWRLSGTRIREYMSNGQLLPSWYTYPEVAQILAEISPPLHKRGVCVWFTGLPCAGKSTIAKILVDLLLASGRRVTLLDGDVVRTHLSKGLAYSREDREANLLRIAFVASEIVAHHGVAVCAAVSPYSSIRSRIRSMFPEGQFVLVFVNTPLSVCEARDTKGLYAKARRGVLKDFTGIDDPYEAPQDAEVAVPTTEYSPEEGADRVLDYLKECGLIQARVVDR